MLISTAKRHKPRATRGMQSIGTRANRSTHGELQHGDRSRGSVFTFAAVGRPELVSSSSGKGSPVRFHYGRTAKKRPRMCSVLRRTASPSWVSRELLQI